MLVIIHHGGADDRIQSHGWRTLQAPMSEPLLFEHEGSLNRREAIAPTSGEFRGKPMKAVPESQLLLLPQVTREVQLQRTAADVHGKKGDICTLGRWTSFSYKPDAALQVLLSKTDLLLVKDRLQRCGIFLVAISILIMLGAALSQHSNPRRYTPPLISRTFYIMSDCSF